MCEGENKILKFVTAASVWCTFMKGYKEEAMKTGG
jgi:hypothetical protein